jgi:hypothetical protein
MTRSSVVHPQSARRVRARRPTGPYDIASFAEKPPKKDYTDAYQDRTTQYQAVTQLRDALPICHLTIIGI